jgi:hypothetical protein
MQHYHGQITEAMSLLSGSLGPWRGRQQQQMKQDAAELAFEQAQRIKQRIERAAALDHAALRHTAAMERFNWLIVQRGRRKANKRLFVATPGCIGLLGELQRRQRDRQIDWAAEQTAALLQQPIARIDTAAAERIGLVSWHVLRGEREKGAFVRLPRDASVEALRRMISDVANA